MDDAIYYNNCEIIQRRWPEVWSKLCEVDPASVPATILDGLGTTVSINGIQLSSRHDRAAEAQTQTACIPETPMLHLYGSGLGDLPCALLHRRSLKQLHVKIMNLTVFSLILHLIEQQEWLADSRVTLSLARDEKEIGQPFFAIPPDLQCAEDAAVGIMQRLETELSDNFVRQRFQADNTDLQRRIQENLSYLQNDDDVASLFNRYRSTTAWVVGAGPTLNTTVHLLKKRTANKTASLLICVDTAVKVLHNAGITPDIVVSIDQRIDLTHFGDFTSHQTKLVYFPLISPEILSSWRGKRYAAYSASPVYAWIRQQVPKAQLHSGGSVIHPAVDLARLCGSSSIVLLGADFGYPMNKTHAGWQDGELGPSMQSANSWTLNGKGERIKSDPNFNSYRCELERYITAYPTVAYYNTSQEGACISGCEYHPEFCA